MKSINKSLLLFFVLFLAISGCRNPSKEPPQPGVIPKEEFTRLMLDLHLADGWFAYRRAQGEDAKALAIRIYDSVFAHHGIARQQFEKSIEWYAARPQLLNKIYDDLIHEVNVMQASVDSSHRVSKLSEEIEKR